MNNGVQGKLNKLHYEPNAKDTFSISQIGESVCLFRKNEWYASQNMFLLSPRYKELVKYHMFISSCITKSLFQYKDAYTYPTLSELEEILILLPTHAGKIDFNLMEKITPVLETSQLTEISNYLTSTGLRDYDLTEHEKSSLKDSVTWRQYKIGDLFRKISTIKLPYKAKDLPIEPTNEFKLPCLTSSFKNQGLNYYVPTEKATILKKVISIPSNSDVYRAYFQSRDFTVLSDAYAIEWLNNDTTLTDRQYLFMVICINKVTDLPIYSYKNKLGGWNVVKEKYILLPTKNDKIDLEYMENFMSAIQKLVIKDVVKYCDKN